MSPEPERYLAQALALDPLRHHIIPLFPRQEQVNGDLVGVIVVRCILVLARELHGQFADRRPRDVLDKEVVDMAAIKDDVKAERQGAGHDDHALV